MKVALGLRPHTGWAVAVAAGDFGSSVVVERRRLELWDEAVPRAVYHAARPLDLGDAIQLVHQAEEAADEAAMCALSEMVAELVAADHDVVAAGVVTSSMRLPSKLADVFASHAFVHAAEGHLFREALVHAVGSCGVHVLEVPARELTARAEAKWGWHPETLGQALAELGRSLGPPWQKDHKDATVAAWLAMPS